MIYLSRSKHRRGLRWCYRMFAGNHGKLLVPQSYATIRLNVTCSLPRKHLMIVACDVNGEPWYFDFYLLASPEGPWLCVAATLPCMVRQLISTMSAMDNMTVSVFFRKRSKDQKFPATQPSLWFLPLQLWNWQYERPPTALPRMLRNISYVSRKTSLFWLANNIQKESTILSPPPRDHSYLVYRPAVALNSSTDT